MNLLLFFRLPSPVQAERKDEINKISRTLTTQFRTLLIGQKAATIAAKQPREFPQSSSLTPLDRLDEYSCICQTTWGIFNPHPLLSVWMFYMEVASLLLCNKCDPWFLHCNDAISYLSALAAWNARASLPPSVPPLYGASNDTVMPPPPRRPISAF